MRKHQIQRAVSGRVYAEAECCILCVEWTKGLHFYSNCLEVHIDFVDGFELVEILFVLCMFKITEVLYVNLKV